MTAVTEKVYRVQVLADNTVRAVATRETVYRVQVQSPGVVDHPVPAGGTTDQHLAKASDADYDMEWVTPVAGGGDVDSVFTRTGDVVAVAGDYNTSQVTELTNLYYTDARVTAHSGVAANTAARHSHANQSELDLVTDGDHDARVDNPHGVDYTDTGAAPAVHLHLAADVFDFDTEVGNHSSVAESYFNIRHILSSTVLTGGTISAGTTAGTLKVSAITALVRSSTSSTAAFDEVSVAETDNIVLAAADTAYRLVLTYTGPGAASISAQTASPNGYDAIAVGTGMKQSDDTVHYNQGGYRLQDAPGKTHQHAKALNPLEVTGGGAITDLGSLEFSIATLVAWAGLNKHTVFATPFDTSGTDVFTYCFRISDVWQYSTGNTAVDDSSYDDNTDGGGGTVGGIISAQQYGVHWVYVHPTDGDVFIVYGQESYTLASAETAQPPANLPLLLTSFGVLLAKILVKTGDTTFTEIQYVTDTMFSGTSIPNHNDLGNLQGGAAGEYNHLDDDQLAAVNTKKIEILIDGQGAVITTGIIGDAEVECSMTLTGWRVLPDQSGTLAVQVWKDTYANYPPLVGDLIVTPTCTTAAKAEATGLSISLTAGDILRFNVSGTPATIERATLVLFGTVA